MQIRLNYDRIAIKNNSITFNAWFNDSNKTCTNCKNNEIEDVNHFLFDCTFDDDVRKKYCASDKNNFVNEEFYRCLTPAQGFYIYNFVNECFNRRFK